MSRCGIISVLKIILTFLIGLCSLIGCNHVEEQVCGHTLIGDLTAVFDPSLKTYVQQSHYLRWHEDDCISVFYGDSQNRKFEFLGKTGDVDGTFRWESARNGKVDCERDAIIALYPYDNEAKIIDDETIAFCFPASQKYAYDSFGSCANVMVAVTEDINDTFLSFKNIGGYLKLKLYSAEELTIKSIKLEGNSGEKISGLADLLLTDSCVPVVEMTDESESFIIMDCEGGVKLGPSEVEPTAFWLVLPPVTFCSGFTITVEDVEGNVYEKSTSSEVHITRNEIQPMQPLGITSDLIVDNSEDSDGSLWIPPKQASSRYTPYDYYGLIDRYDQLASKHPDYIKKEVFAEKGYGDYPLVHYVLEPENYSKTFYIQAGIHGNEHDAPQTLHRIVEILCEETSRSSYNALMPLRNNVRFVIIPCVSPWGWDNGSMNRPYEPLLGTNTMMNMNRNLDYNHQYALEASGSGGNYPWQVPETRHILSVLESIYPENIDYAIDFHDGGNVKEHFWINYNMDSPNAPMVRKLVQDLISYEDKNYPQYRDPEKGWVIPHCSDAGGYSTGTTSAFLTYSYGIPSSTCEYMGGYFGYAFDSEQMTRSLRIRANMLLYAYRDVNKGWSIDEANGAPWFRFDYPRSMTRQGLRRDGAKSSYCQTVVTFDDVYSRWDALVENYPDRVKKSASLGENCDGNLIYSYTIGNGDKKVLFVGGAMRWSSTHKETEFGAYVLAENLCEDYLVKQSPLLQKLLNEYSIVVLPCINSEAGGNAVGLQEIGLNCSALTFKKWMLEEDKCQPTSYALEVAHDIPILLSFLNNNKDASLIISGGEDTSGYLYEYPKYEQNYMTQFILPKNLQTPEWLSSFAAYLRDERGEDPPSIENTDGKTFVDWAYDNLQIPGVYLNMKLDGNWERMRQYAAVNEKEGDGSRYFYRTYETGRRLSAIVNLILSAE